MPKMKSKRIAVPTNLLKRATYTMSIRSVKAFLFPFTQVYWGAQEDMNYTERKSSKIYIDIEDFAEVVGYSIASRITIMIVEKENMYINFVNQHVQNAQEAISTPIVKFSLIQTSIENGPDPFWYLTQLLKTANNADLTDPETVLSQLL